MRTCVILCGGYGTRAKKINNLLPKILINVHGKPYLFWILKNLEKKKIKEIILCVGYKSENIYSYLRKNKNNFKLKIKVVAEKSGKLLGTGGAVKNSLKFFNRNEFLVMYGDTFLFFDVNRLFKSYKINNKPILMTVYKNNSKYYKNNIKINKHLTYDKSNKKNDYEYIDYGVLVMNKKVFKNQPKVFDLSKLLKKYSMDKKISHLKIKKKFLEIGNIESYKNTLRNFKKIKNEIYK